MSNLGAFASLLQLGFGIGIGLSVFRTPLTLRATILGKRLDSELTIIRDIRSTQAEELRGKISSAKLVYHNAMQEIEKSYLPLMGAVLVGAAANLVALIASSLYPDMPVDGFWATILIIVSFGYYVALALIIEVYTRYRMRPVYAEVDGFI